MPYTVLAEGRGRGRHVWSVNLSAPSTCVAFAPDGRRVAVAGKDGGVDLWDVQRGELARSLVPAAGGSGRVRALGFAASGRLAAAGDDGVVRVWEADGRELPPMPGHTRSVHSLAISTDGQMVATAADDDTVRLWGLDGVVAPVRKLDMKTRGAGSLALDRDVEKLFLAASDDSLSMLDVGVRNAKQFPPELMEKRLIGHIRPLAGGIRHVNYMPAFTPGGEQMVAFSAAAPEACALVQLWDLTYWRDAGRLHHDRRITSVAIVRAPPPAQGLPQRHPAVCSSSEDGVIRVWDTGSRTVKIELTGHEGAVTSIAVSPDGRLLASVGVDGTMRVWDIDTGYGRKGIFRPGRHAASFAYTTDNSGIIEVTKDDGRVEAYDTRARRSMGTLPLSLGALRGALASSPDGRRVAALLSGRVAVFDVRVEGGRPSLVPAGSTPVSETARALGFTAGGRPLVLERTAAGFAVRDLAGGPVLSEMLWPPPETRERPPGEPLAIAVGAGASRVLLVGGDGRAYLWTPGRSGRTAEVYSNVKGVTAAAIAPGSDATALGDASGAVYVWEPGRQRAVQLDAHHSPVHELAFSADGKALASRGDEPVIRSFDLEAFGDADEVLDELRLTSPYRYDAAEMGLVKRSEFHPRPRLPSDYRFPEEKR